jgi:nucleoside 2-deoxyribosyltransferase
MNIFLAAPFTDRIDPSTHVMEQSYRRWLEQIIQYLESLGYRVIGAHRREDWGAKLESPETAIQNDFAAVRDCELLIAYPGNPPSPGVQMELGFAAAFKKPIILIQENQSRIPYLLTGLGKLTRTSLIRFTNSTQLLEQLGRELESVTKVTSKR